jgi:hypothetical protein
MRNRIPRTRTGISREGATHLVHEHARRCGDDDGVVVVVAPCGHVAAVCCRGCHRAVYAAVLVWCECADELAAYDIPLWWFEP